MSTIVTRAGKGSSLTWLEVDSNFTNLNTDKLQSVSQDLNPSLGGNLDVNGKTIVSSSNGNITITPNGTGVVVIKGVKVGTGAGNVVSNVSIGNGTLFNNTTGSNITAIGYYANYNNITGVQSTSLGFESLFTSNASNQTAIGYRALYSTTGASNTALGHSAGSAITTGTKNVVIGSNNGSTIATTSNNIIISDGDGNIRISVTPTGAVKLGSIQYPTADGTNGQVLVTNGSGVLSFATVSGGSSSLSTLTDVSLSSPTSGQVLKYNGTLWANATDNGLTAISQDSTPSLGGNLDTGSYTISSSTGNVIVNDVLTVNGVLFNTAAGLTSTAPGQLVWNDTEATLEYMMKGGNVTLQLGMEEVQYVLNNTGGALTDGTVVYVTGSSGQRLTIDTATASTEATSFSTIGVLTENIANNQQGYMATQGVVRGLNTLGMTEGAGLWLSTTPGLFTTTRPTAPNHGVFVGWVVRAHQTQGSIYVHIQNGYELDELHNVAITSPATGQILAYDATLGYWKNATETDPVFTASPAHGITSTNITNWDTAYGWGNHASAGYQPLLVSGTNIKTVNGSTLLGAGNIVVSSGTGLGSLTAYKADGSQDDLPVNATTALNQLTINQELLYNKNALIAIDTTGQYGWRDITSDINVKGTGTNNPTWGLIRNGLYGYTFSATTMQECWTSFHINHDYALGTAIYLHAHWVNPGTNTGTVRFGFEYSIAKGHQQEIFPATTTVYVEQASTGQYYHMIAEIATGITSASLEPDAIVLVRIFRDAANVADTCTDAIAIITSDVHYQANKFATKNKAPAFNV